MLGDDALTRRGFKSMEQFDLRKKGAAESHMTSVVPEEDLEDRRAFLKNGCDRGISTSRLLASPKHRIESKGITTLTRE